MTQPTHEQLEDLLRTLVLPFYHIYREMPLPIGERRWENDAEHSWSLALLAASLAPEVDPGLDVGLICQFATVHDLVEVHAGDTSALAPEARRSTKAAREAAALEQIASQFAHFPWIIKTIEAYERQDSDEARFVYALDKYIAVTYDYIDKAQFFKDSKVTLAQYNKTLAAHRNKAHRHPIVAKYYDEVRALIDAHPEYFHPDLGY